MNENELVKQAEELTKAYESLKLVTDLLSNINTSYIEGEKLSAHWFFASGQADNFITNLQNISDSILQASNEICPD